MPNDKLLRSVLAASKPGDKETAAAFFARLVQENPGSEKGWLGLGLCITDKDRRTYCLNRVLTINPENAQAKEALQQLENPDPASAPSTRWVMPPVPTVGPTPPTLAPSPFDPQTAPILLPPFLEEDLPPSNQPEPPFIQAMHTGPTIQEVPPENKLVEPLDVFPSPVPEEIPLDGSAPKPKKKRTILTVVLLISIVPIVICILSVIYLFMSGGASALLLRVAPVPTARVLPLPTRTATLVPTITSTPTASPTPLTPTPTLQLELRPTIVYTPLFANTACQFMPPEGVKVTCGYVSMPEDRTNLQSKTIQLAVAIFHAFNPNPAPDPVVFLQGGPGGEAVRLSADNFNLLVKPFLDARDFIAFDQRGTGISIPALGCDELEKVYKQDIYGQIPASSRDYIYTNAFRSCHGAMTLGGIDLNSYTTVASSDDLNDIVTALGYKQVDLYAASYGTRLALVTMRDYPAIVRSAVLDSVVPVETKLFDEDPVRYASALQAMFDGCAADTRCNFAYPNLEKVFWALVDQLDANPVRVTAPLLVGTNTEYVVGSDLIGLTLGLLKTTRLIANAPETIYKIKAGDYSSFSAMQSSLPYEFQGINIGLYTSMMCHEHILATTPQDLQAAMDSQHDIGRYFRLPFFGDAKTIFNTCKVWGSQPPAPGENAAVVSDIPTLIIEGKYDPSTPPDFGKQVASKLTRSYYMEFPNQGHTPTATDTSGCAFRTMLSFFGDPTQPPDMACLADIHGVDFVLPEGMATLTPVSTP